MDQILTLSRGKLAAFLTCPRRFQLRYLRRLPWPVAPADERGESARRRGERFHQLLQRHFLGLPVAEELAADQTLRRWWAIFQQQGPALPEGHRFPEFSLTVPAGRHLLTGRFDLLVLNHDRAHIFDWKTEARPRPEADLRGDLQTQLYLALLLMGGPALGRRFRPEQVAITYWYVNAPEAAVTISYDDAWHRQNWANLQRIVADIDSLPADDGDWAPTDDLTACAHCLYQVYCGRQTPGFDPALWEPDEEEPRLEPEPA